MISAYIAHYRRTLEALPGGPYPGADPGEAALLAAAVDAAAKGEPVTSESDNGLFRYLAAASAIKAGDLHRVMAEVRLGNAASRVEMVVSQNPITTACPALGPVRLMAQRSDVLIGTDPTAAGDLLDTALRVARAEPRSLINLIVGASIVNLVLKADHVAARESGDSARVREAARLAAKHRDWMTAVFRMGMTQRKLVILNHGRFHRMAGVTGAELAAYFKGELKDPRKVAALETAADLEYRKERVKVERYLRQLPNG